MSKQSVKLLTVLIEKHGSKFLILAPIIRGRKGEYKKELLELQKKGFQRVKIDGVQYEFDDLPSIDKRKAYIMLL